MSVLKLTADAIMTKLDEWNVTLGDADVLIPDREYACPTRDWIAGEFSNALKPVLDATVGSWDDESSDCDDFAEEAASYAHRCHRKTLDRPRETALAFGEFWYEASGRGGHAINCFIALDHGDWRLFFYEPQTCSIVTLTEKEKRSCQMVRF